MSRYRGRPRFIDQAIRPQTARPEWQPPAAVSQKLSPPPTRHGVFFDVQVCGIHKGKTVYDSPRQEIIAGHFYSIVLRGGINGTALKPNYHPLQGILIENTIKLQILLPPEVQIAEKLVKAEYKLSYEEARRFSVELKIRVPENTLSQSIRFSVRYQEREHVPFRDLGEHSIRVCGTRNPEDQELLRRCQIQAGLPMGTALLWIGDTSASAQEAYLRLHGWSWQGERLEESVKINSAITNVAGMCLQRYNKISPDVFINRLNLFSRTISRQFINWLAAQKCVYPHQQASSLIIVDETEREIPWEMLNLRPGDYHYLGSLLNVVRWLPPRYSQLESLEVKDVQYTGGTISYLDKGLGEDKIQAEQVVLQKLQARDYGTLEELGIYMRKPRKDVALVYIGSHGESGNRLHAADVQNPSNILHAIQMEELGAHSSLIAFVNACESGRIQRNNSNRGDSSNFVDGFLAHGFSGYIGTLAPVRVQTASQIAGKLLDMVVQEDGIRIADALRILREDAVTLLRSTEELPNSQRQKELDEVIDTFMYVYYGNPLARLRLRPPRSEHYGEREEKA